MLRKSSTSVLKNERERLAKFKFSWREVEALEDTQLEEKKLKAGGRARDFFRPPHNYCEHRAFVALNYFLEAINYLEFEDTRKYRRLSKAHHLFHKMYLSQVLRGLLEDPAVQRLNLS